MRIALLKMRITIEWAWWISCCSIFSSWVLCVYLFIYCKEIKSLCFKNGWKFIKRKVKSQRSKFESQRMGIRWCKQRSCNTNCREGPSTSCGVLLAVDVNPRRSNFKHMSANICLYLFWMKTCLNMQHLQHELPCLPF